MTPQRTGEPANPSLRNNLPATQPEPASASWRAGMTGSGLGLKAILRLLQSHPGLRLAGGVYLCLAFSYFFLVPIFEAPDEWTHTGHVKYIAEGNGLPVMLPGQGIWGGQQPPLYYLIGAVLVQPFELTAFDDYLERYNNPHGSAGYALDPGNKNNYLHGPAETFPYRDLALTVHVLRLYSMGLGLIALGFSYFVAFELAGGGKAWFPPPPGSAGSVTPFLHSPQAFATLVALLMACQPMFAFITASVANEPANMAFCAIGLWLAQRYVLYGPTAGWRRAVVLGLILGLISLAKMTGLSLGLVAVVAMLQAAITSRKQAGAARLLWRDGLIIGLLFLAVGGWWYWRNYQLYGDFFQQGLYKLYFKVDPQPLNLNDFLFILFSGEVSFWATFGWLNIVGPDWVYQIYWLVSRLGLVGLGLLVIFQFAGNFERRRQPPTPWALDPRQMAQERKPFIIPRFSHLILHFVFPLALAFSLTRLVATEGGLQGRQLLPALGSLAILIGAGWWTLWPARLRPAGLGLLLALLLGLALWLPYSLVARAFTPPPLLGEADLPAGLSRLDWSYAGKMKLIGAEIGREQVQPGERVPVTLYWQALAPMETNYSVFVHLIGRNYTIVGQFNTYPGLGLHPTRTLEPGQIVRDTYPVLVEGGSEAPSRLQVAAGLFDFKEAGRPGLPALGPDGREISPYIGQLKLVPQRWPPPPAHPPLAEFADSIRLGDYHFDGCTGRETGCTLTLIWVAQGRPSTDYTVFVQVWQGDKQVAGFDAPPLTNDYPTSLWAAQEVIIDPHPLDLSQLPPGDYQVLVGLYNFATGERLPAAANSIPLPANALDLGLLQVR